MKYLIYKITNLVNGKIYIGRHQTNDVNDGYMSSSVPVKQAIQKYGIENFRKEILHECVSLDEMVKKEAELVTVDFCQKPNVYNISIGGLGTSNFLKKEIREKAAESRKQKGVGVEFDNNARCRGRETQKKNGHCFYDTKFQKEMTLRTFSAEALKKKKESYAKIGHQQGEKNTQFGTMWITNGKDNKKIKKDDTIPNNWRKGRVIQQG